MIKYLIIGSVVSGVIGIVMYLVITRIILKHMNRNEFSEVLERLVTNIMWGLGIFLVPLVTTFGLIYLDNTYKDSPFISLISCLLWLLAFLLINRVLNHCTINNYTDEMLSVDYKVALAYWGMLTSFFVYAVHAIKTAFLNELDSWAISASFIIIVLILGFCVPLELLFTNTSLGQRKRIIFKNLKIDEVFKKDKVNKYSMIVFMLYSIAAVLSIFLENNMELCWTFFSVIIGIHIGFLLAILMYAIKNNKKYDCINDCIDTRKKIFNSIKFMKFKDRIKNEYKIKKFDLITSVILFNWFIEKEKDEKGFCRENYYTGFNYLYNDYKYIQYYRENGAFIVDEEIEADNPKDEKFKTSKKPLFIDYIVSPWILLKKYIDVFLTPKKGDMCIDDTNCLLNDWYTRLLKQYSELTNKERKKLIPKKIQKYIVVSHKKAGCWVIPYVYTNSNQSISSLSFFKKGYNYIDIILMDIYKWFESGKKDNSIIFELCSSQQNAEEFIKFLKPFDNWSLFVRLNHLEVFCKRKHIFTSVFEIPKKITKNYDFINNANKEDKDKWLKMFKSLAKKIAKRRFYMDKDYGDNL